MGRQAVRGEDQDEKEPGPGVFRFTLITEGVAGHVRGLFPKLEVQVQRGEQAHYPYILSLE